MSAPKSIPVNAPDFELFDQDLTKSEYEFFLEFDTGFQNLWTDMGEPGRMHFIKQYYDFCKKHGLIKNFPSKTSVCMKYFEEARVYLQQSFAKGTFSMAKELIGDIAFLAKHSSAIKIGDKSKDITSAQALDKRRQKVRKFFGDPSDPRTTKKLATTFQFFTNFGGAVCRGLKRVIDELHKITPQYVKLNPDIDIEALRRRAMGIYDTEDERDEAYERFKQTLERVCNVDFNNPANTHSLKSKEEVVPPHDVIASFTLQAGDNDNFKVSMEGPKASLKFDMTAKSSDDEGDGDHFTPDEVLKHFWELNGREYHDKGQPSTEKNEGRKVDTDGVKKLHHCAYCMVLEEEPRTYKKCGRCRGKGTRFYCSEYCQAKHWVERHHRQHP